MGCLERREKKSFRKNFSFGKRKDEREKHQTEKEKNEIKWFLNNKAEQTNERVDL